MFRNKTHGGYVFLLKVDLGRVGSEKRASDGYDDQKHNKCQSQNGQPVLFRSLPVVPRQTAVNVERMYYVEDDKNEKEEVQVIQRLKRLIN